MVADSLRLSRKVQAGVLLAAALTGVQCDLSVPTPTGVVVPGTIEGKAGLPVRLAGAIGDFAIAYGGNNPDDGLILVSGLFVDEFQQAIGTPDYVTVDLRAAATTNSLNEIVYHDLQRARAAGEETVQTYREFDSTAVGGLYARNLAGYAYVLLAENFCSGMPFSHAAPDGTITYGAAETTVQILDRAVADFDSALAVASVLAGLPPTIDSIADQENLARVGRARALLDLGRYAEAGAESASVPDGFVWITEYSDNADREENGVYYYAAEQQWYSLADSEGVNGIGFLAAGDPRALVDTLGPIYAPGAYDNPSAPITLASTTEARLIQAEAELQAGSPVASLAVLNALRAPLGLAPLTDPGTPDGRVTQLFRERAFWLWVTAHRLGDLRRLVRQYGRAADQVYPTGRYSGAPGSYGNQASLGFNESNNPRYDPAACDPTQP